MKCSLVRAMLFEHADGEIPGQFREEVNNHLAACKSCAALSCALDEQALALRALPGIAAPATMLEIVRGRLEKPSPRSKFKHWLQTFFEARRFFKVAGAATVAMLLILSARVAFRENASREVLLSRPPSPAEAEVPQAAPPPRAAPAQSREYAAPLAPHVVQTTRVLALVLKLSTVSAAGGTRRSFEQKNFACQKSFSHFEMSPARPLPENIVSCVTRLVERAGGKVLNAPAPRHEGRSEELLTEIPRASFHSFLAGMRKLGEVELRGKRDLPPYPNAKVRLSISLDKK